MYHELIFRPLYNGLVGIINTFPWADLGIATILFTIVVKTILYPLAKLALMTQIKMKEVEPEVNRIKNQYKDDRQNQALKIMQVYKEKKIKPFSGFLLILIQFPILFALISVFYKIIPTVDASFLYDFVSQPLIIKTEFLGLIDLTQKSLILSFATAIIQFIQLHFSLATKSQNKTPNNSQDSTALIMSSMNTQMKYLLPVIAFVSTYWLIPVTFPQAASVIAIYWSTSTFYTLIQELIIGRKIKSVARNQI